MNDVCDCKHCRFWDSVEAIKGRVSAEDAAVIDELATRCMSAEDDSAVWEAKAKGTWPGWPKLSADMRVMG